MAKFAKVLVGLWSGIQRVNGEGAMKEPMIEKIGPEVLTFALIFPL